MTDRQCERCKTVTMIDSFHRLCFDCFCELDMKAVEEEEFLRFLEDEQNTSATRTSEGTAADDFAEEEE